MQSGIGSIQLLNYEIKAWRTKLFIKTLLKHLLDGCFMMAGLASTLVISQHGQQTLVQAPTGH